MVMKFLDINTCSQERQKLASLDGAIDTGIWPESESFNDDGFCLIPKKLKGECAGGLNFTRNKKMIGARSYSIEGILSGRSMTCSHVAAATAYVKSLHPKWSPSAIVAALINTARKMDPAHNSQDEFTYGSGHIDHVKGMDDPGLVYDTAIEDYHNIWWHAQKAAGNATIKNTTCPEKLKLSEINYPSMAVLVDVKSPFVISFPRTVTNVGQLNATYVASIQKESSKLNFSVEPSKLEFTSQNQMISFVVTVRGSIESSLTAESISLTWTDGIHVVRSPIVVYTGETSECKHYKRSRGSRYTFLNQNKRIL